MAAVQRLLQDLNVDLGNGVDHLERGRLAEVTGYWGAPLEQFFERCGERPGNWQRILEELHAQLTSDARWREAVGVPSEVQGIFMELLHEGDHGCTLEELQILTDADGSDIERVIRWAERLAYIQEMPGNRWRADPFIARLVLQRSVEAS